MTQLADMIRAQMEPHSQMSAATIAKDLGRPLDEVCATIRLMPELKLGEIKLTVTHRRAAS